MLLKLFINYAGVALLLFVVMLLYFKHAVRYNIIDKPNSRSSHNTPTIRGGGIIFVVAVVIFFLFNNFVYSYLLLAVLLAGTISFIDDMHTVNNRLKFGVHFVSVLLIFQQCNLIATISFLYLILIMIIVIGIINAYNFMDGINGITGLYSLAILLPLLLTEQNEQLYSLEVYLFISLLVFNFYNTRKKAKCFAGDVGSISLAIIIVFVIIMRIQQTQRFDYIGLLLVYGIDTVFTIIQRILQKENIFKPHRKHLYQYFVNEKKTSHLPVSILYALLQLVISALIVTGYLHSIWLLILLLLLSVFYWLLKAPLIKISQP